jgi:mannose-6-phosphate isomerase-like protein (cupin superfamily)
MKCAGLQNRDTESKPKVSLTGFAASWTFVHSNGISGLWRLLMAVQRWRALESDVLVKPGIQSRQLVWPKNSPESQTTITHVTMEPGAVSDRHAHQRSEQIWIVERGEGLLLLENEHSEVLRAGDIVRTPAGENAWGSEQRQEPLVYLAVTTPPQNFSSAYKTAESAIGS